MDRNATQNINIESNIKCLQINLQRCKAATAHLMKYIENKNIDILLIQEPYFAKGKVCGFSSKYRIYYCESAERAKTAIIVINDLLQVVYIKTFIKDYLTVISVKFRNKLYYMFSLYCSPEQDLNRELQFLKSALIALKPQNVVISIDSNAKSRVWFSNCDDFRGELINDFIAENNFILLNNNENTPTFYTTRGESYIDLTLINANSAPYVHNWKVLEIDSISDHRYIVFDINDQIPEIKFKSTVKYNTSKANWDQFNRDIYQKFTEIEPELNSIENTMQLNNFVENFNSLLTDICDKHIPIYKNKINLNSNYWWTEELTNARRAMNRARRRFQRCQTDARSGLKELYMNIKAEYKQLINKQKMTAWHEFIGLNSRDNPWGLTYKMTRNKLKSDKVYELLSTNGELITNDIDIAEVLLAHFFR